jgi:uncharacterized coiled-coil DUF342 family protein
MNSKINDVVEANDKIDALRKELFAVRKELTETEKRYYDLLQIFIAICPTPTE